VAAILGANYDGEVSSLAWIAHPTLGGVYDKLVDGEDRPLPPTPWAAALRRLYTTSLGTDTMLVGDFSQLLIGQRFSGLKIEVLPAGTVIDDASVTHNAVAEMKRFIRAYLRVDFAVMRPTWFNALTGVTTGA